MDPTRFVADLEAKPAALAALAEAIETVDPLGALPVEGIDRVVLLGMGSSRYAALVAAQRLRAGGLDAVAEYASAERGTPAGPTTLAIAISATGASAETLAAAGRHAGRSHLVALTNAAASPLAVLADGVVPLVAGDELGGVACRTYQHTLLVLRAIEARLTGAPDDVAALCRRVAAATADLLDRRGAWLPQVLAALDGPDGVAFIAPAERLSSAEQSALMIREGPRRPAAASETGDWSHVDVYLTRTRDYRAVLYRGSRWDGPALEWLARRGSTVVAVGAPGPGAGDEALPPGAVRVRYRDDDDADVALATEVLVAELVAAAWWAG